MRQDTWHSIEADEALRRLDAGAQGLNAAVAQQRLSRYGPNTSPEKKRRALRRILLQRFSDFMIIVLLAAVMLTLLLQLAVIYLPALNAIFYTQPLPVFDLAVGLMISSLVPVAVEVEKWLKRRRVFYTESS